MRSTATVRNFRRRSVVIFARPRKGGERGIKRSAHPFTLVFLLWSLSAVLLREVQAQTVGTLDSTYGTNGKASISLATGITYGGVAQSDGKIVVVGYSQEGGHADITAIRFTTAGVIDSTFGANGKALITYSPNPIVYAAAVQPDDKIVLAGTASTADDIDYDLMVVRLDANGALDSTFGTNGIVITAGRHHGTGQLGIVTEARAVAIQPDGKIVAAGRTFEVNYDASPIIVRYDSTGAIDPTFNGSGVVVDSTDAGYGYSEWTNALALQPDGKIIIAGSTNSFGLSYGLAAEVLRFNSDGTLDNSFASDTRVQKSFGTTAEANAVTLLSDGSILLAGYSGASSPVFYIVKYSSSGHFDNSFGGTSDGVTLSFTGGSDVAYACSATPDGNLLVAGGGSNYFEAAQFTAGGTLVSNFASSGKTTIDMGATALARSIAFSSTSGSRRFFLMGSAGYDYSVAKFYLETPASPTASTDSVSSIQATTATAYSTVNPNVDTTTVRFLYGTTSGSYPDSVVASQSPLTGYASTQVTANLSGLTGGQTYYLRVSASNSLGYVRGSEISFTTLPPPAAPTAVTDSVSSIGTTTATAYGSANPGGDSTTVRFLYGTVSGSYTDSVVAAQSPVTGYNPVSVSANLSGLTSYQTYYLRVVGSNAVGYARGSEVSFKTKAVITETAPSGSGTTGDPHIIASLNNLAWLQDAANDTAWGDYYKQTANIEASQTSTWNSGAGFSPIGTGAHSFSGTYDGQGYFVDSLYLSRTDSGDNYQALFGYLGSSAVIDSLGVTNASISGYDFVGALAGLNPASSSISHCYSSGAVHAVRGDCGGLVGENDGSLLLSYSSCCVSGGNNFSMGGLVGYSPSGTISNCYTTGEVNVTCPGAGGLVGNNSGASIDDCYSVSKVATTAYYGGGLIGSQFSGSVSASFWNTDSTSVGAGLGSIGAAGKTSAQMKMESTYMDSLWDFTSTWGINNSANDGYPYLKTNLVITETAPSGSGTSGDPHIIASLPNVRWLQDVANDTAWGDFYRQTANIEASATSSWNAGAGFSPIGTSTHMFSGTYDGQGYVIDSLYIARTGNGNNYQALFGAISPSSVIKNLGVTNANVSGYDFVGALAGLNSSGASITDCYSTGKVYASYGDCGGLIGENDGSVARSYSNCTVTGGSNYSMGGFVGYCPFGSDTISNCYSTGEVSTACDGTGGLVGNHSGGNILDCYSISKASTTASGAIPGGLIGGNYTSDPVTNSFFDTDSTSSSAAGTGESSSSLKTLSTFTNAGWDFVKETTNGTNDYWDMDTTNKVTNSGYPFLSWQEGGSVALPVEMASFTATSSRLTVTVEWKTASEVNTNGFEIQRAQLSESGTTIQPWQDVGFVKGHGTSTAPIAYSCVDRGLTPGTYSYRLKQIDNNGSAQYSKTVNIEVGKAPRTFTLSQNYPNPFNPTTTIEFTIAEDGRVVLKVYDVLGREVATLLDENRSAGEYQQVVFDASRYASGIYFAVLQAGGKRLLKKMLLLK